MFIMQLAAWYWLRKNVIFDEDEEEEEAGAEA